MPIVERLEHLPNSTLKISEEYREFLPSIILNSLNDPLLRSITPRDAERFRDTESALAFLGDRTVYTISNEDTLAGLIWFSEKKWPLNLPNSPRFTYAIRMYKPFRGAGLAAPFSTKVVEDFTRKHLGEPLWLETNSDNATAIHLYEKTGWRKRGEYKPEEHRTRLVMTYGLEDYKTI